MVGVAEHDLRAEPRSSSGSTPLTVAFVPTGMKAGVGTSPCAVCRDARARSAVGRRWKFGLKLNGQAWRRRRSRSGSARRSRAGRGAGSPRPRRRPSRARAASSAAGGSSSAARRRGGTRSPGVMKRSVRPESGAPRASDSSTRTVVVPTASTWLRRRGCAPSWQHRPHSARREARAPRGWRPSTGRKVSRPTCSVTRSTSSRSSSSGVKWRPAVGAAAEPASRAYTVW